MATLPRGGGRDCRRRRTAALAIAVAGLEVSVESTLGEGSRFCVEPVERAKEAEVTAGRIDYAGVVGLARGQPEFRILIVEDQKENWLLSRRLLEGAGFTVRVAENGLLGLEMFQSCRPHFIYMDIRLPVMGGLEMTRRIRALEGGSSVKIAALTASVFKEEHDTTAALRPEMLAHSAGQLGYTTILRALPADRDSYTP